MQIPDSIEKLTTTVMPDPFNVLATIPPLPLDDIIAAIRRSLNSKDLSSFESGLLFFKQDSSSAKFIIRNFISLFSSTLSKAIDESDINADFKDGLSFEVKNIINSLSQNFEAIDNILINFNNNKNVLDANNITLIILGYAIGLLKKKHNN